MKDKRPTKRFAAPARAGRPLRPQQLLILAYAAAVIVWLVYVLVGSAVMLNHKADGTMVTRTLTADDLEFESFVNYDDDEWHTAPVDEPGWYLSTDNDPHIIWRGEAWLETVELDAVHYLPPGSVALYYLRPGQTEYSETQKVFARVSGENQYTFAYPAGRRGAQPGAAVVPALCAKRRPMAAAVVCPGCGGCVCLPCR